MNPFSASLSAMPPAPSISCTGCWRASAARDDAKSTTYASTSATRGARGATMGDYASWHVDAIQRVTHTYHTDGPKP
eukprot:4552352-Prymnesium_polylepis.2